MTPCTCGRESVAMYADGACLCAECYEKRRATVQQPNTGCATPPVADAATEEPDFRQTTDALLWAKAFLKTRAEIVARGDDANDEGWVLGWFANAMMVAHDHARIGLVELDAADSIPPQVEVALRYLELLEEPEHFGGDGGVDGAVQAAHETIRDYLTTKGTVKG